LQEFIRILDSWGLRDVMLPFLFIFVIFFALLSKIRIFGEDKKKFNLVVALVVALLVVIPHVLDKYPPDMDPVDIMNEAIPNITIVVIAAISSLFIIGLFGGRIVQRPAYITGGVIVAAAMIYIVFVYPTLSPMIFAIGIILLIAVAFSGKQEGFNWVQAVVTLLCFIAVFYFFGVAKGWFEGLPLWLEDPIYQGVIVTVTIVGVLVAYVLYGGD